MSVLLRHVSGRATSIIALLALIVFLPLFVIGITQTMTLISRASGTPANIVVDVKATQEQIKTDFIHGFAQGGEESNDMLAPVAADVKALHPRVIRIDHLYDNYNVVGKNGDTLTYDWTKLDTVVSSILATGAKPVLALSYMPSVIAKDGNIINPPNDWNQWAAVVEATITHFSGKGARNISGIYYEVWNEPDLEQFGKWGLGGDKNYLTLYKYAADGAAAAKNVNQFYLGGPATTGLYKNWVLALVQSGSRLNFLSWHSYLSDPLQYAKDQHDVVTWLLPFPAYTLIPKLITEFGFTGRKSEGYNGTYAMAHAAASFRQLISGGPTYVLSFELKDGPSDSNSGWGLITNDGSKKKPRYYVYNFLDEMAGTRLYLTGEGSWVTGFATMGTDKVIRINLTNFALDGTHTENVLFKLTNLDNGTYKVRQRFLLGRDTTTSVTVTDGTLSSQIYMGAESVAIISLAKQ
jgi:hypothetical protein